MAASKLWLSFAAAYVIGAAGLILAALTGADIGHALDDDLGEE